MPILAVAVVLLILGMVWVSQLRRRRRRWLRALDLNGRWQVQAVPPNPSNKNDPTQMVIEFVGNLTSGEYRWLQAGMGSETGFSEQGQWAIGGSTLSLRPKPVGTSADPGKAAVAGELRDYELRLLKPRVLGLVAKYDGARLELRKEHSNVVPLTAKGRRR